MKLMSIHKKAIASLMAVLMIAAVSTTSAFALTEGSYTATLTANVAFPPHDLDFLVNPAEVTTDGDYSTVVIELENPASVTVTLPGQPPYVAYGEVLSAYTETEGYYAEVVDGYLFVTGPSDVITDDFEPVIHFEIDLEVDNPDNDHSDMPATLHLSAI
jgi:hypothetical protein